MAFRKTGDAPKTGDPAPVKKSGKEEKSKEKESK